MTTEKADQNGQMSRLILASLGEYSKTGLKRPLKMKIKNWFSGRIIAKCGSKVLQNAPRALCNTFDLH